MAELFEGLMREATRLSAELRAERAERARVQMGLIRIRARIERHERFDIAGAIDDLVRA